jgi:hypothetical protein
LVNGDDDVDNANFPSAERQAKREVFLASLARAIAELRTLEFDDIGVLDFDDIDGKPDTSIGPCWHWRTDYDTTAEEMDTDKVLREQPVSNSSQDLLSDSKDS